MEIDLYINFLKELKKEMADKQFEKQEIINKIKDK